MRNLNEKKGFTVVELMMALGISAILIAAIYSVLLVADLTTRTGLIYIELSQDVRFGVEYMMKELHNARRSTISIPDGSYIEFQVPGNPNTIQYSLGGLNGTQLIRTEEEANTILCNNAQSIQFSPSPFSGSIIYITLQAWKTSSSQRGLITALNVSLKVRN